MEDDGELGPVHGPGARAVEPGAAVKGEAGAGDADCERSAKRARSSSEDAGTRAAGAGGALHHGYYEENTDAWAAWEEEMKQYPGWEDGGGEGVMHVYEDDESDPAAQVDFTAQLLEDMETRVKILAVMAEAGG